MPAVISDGPAPCFRPGVYEAGVDEAGRGALAGPVVAACVALAPGYDNPRLRDSKKLTAARRAELRDIILRDCEDWGLGVIPVETIDRINILQAAVEAMHEAVRALRRPPELLLVDGKYFRGEWPFQCFVQGDDRFQAIAAASILAKVFRDEIMQALHADFPFYGWAGNKGYPTQAHRAAILRFGASPWHRTSFRLTPAQPLPFSETTLQQSAGAPASRN